MTQRGRCRNGTTPFLPSPVVFNLAHLPQENLKMAWMGGLKMGGGSVLGLLMLSVPPGVDSGEEDGHSHVCAARLQTKQSSNVYRNAHTM